MFSESSISKYSRNSAESLLAVLKSLECSCVHRARSREVSAPDTFKGDSAQDTTWKRGVVASSWGKGLYRARHLPGFVCDCLYKGILESIMDPIQNQIILLCYFWSFVASGHGPLEFHLSTHTKHMLPIKMLWCWRFGSGQIGQYCSYIFLFKFQNSFWPIISP